MSDIQTAGSENSPTESKTFEPVSKIARSITEVDFFGGNLVVTAMQVNAMLVRQLAAGFHHHQLRCHRTHRSFLHQISYHNFQINTSAQIFSTFCFLLVHDWNTGTPSCYKLCTHFRGSFAFQLALVASNDLSPILHFRILKVYFDFLPYFH